VLRAYLAAVASLLASGYVAAVSAIAAHDVRVDSTGGLAAAWLSTALLLIILVLVAFWLVFAGRLVLTWRRASGERRQQLKSLMTGSVIAIVAGAVNSIVSALDPHGQQLSRRSPACSTTSG
jgi:preprotein translocase subunit YajC